MGSDWNSMPSDGLRIEGDLTPNHQAHTGLVNAFTLGLLTEKGWLTHRAINLLDLVSQVEHGKKKERKLLVSLPPESLSDGFMLFDKGNSNPNDKLWLHLYYDDKRSLPNTTFVFHHLKLKEKKPMKFHKVLPVASIIYTFDWDGNVDIAGQTG